jgi:hypothetical protein
VGNRPAPDADFRALPIEVEVSTLSNICGHPASVSTSAKAQKHRLVAAVADLQAEVDLPKVLQAKAVAELDALLFSVFDKAFKGAQ